MSRSDRLRARRIRPGHWLLLFLLAAASEAAADDVAGQITAVTGAVEGGRQGEIAEGDHIKLGDDGGCSILVDEDAVVEMCGETTLALRKDKQRRVVALDRGEIRLVVEPRTFEQRVEIHTPAAVATLLGTIVHVSVDEAGVTTISSAESRISVRSANPAIRGTTVIDTAERVTVVPGLAPPTETTRMQPVEISALGGCLVDFHSAAIGRDARLHSSRAADRLAALDAVFANPPGLVVQHEPGIRALTDEAIASQDGVCTATDCSRDAMRTLETLDAKEPTELDPKGQFIEFTGQR